MPFPSPDPTATSTDTPLSLDFSGSDAPLAEVLEGILSVPES